MHSECKNYPMKELRAIFPISSILVIRSVNAKQSHFQYLLYFKMYGIYMNLGCRFEFRTQKLPYERISDNFSDFIDFGHQVRICEIRSFSILAVFQNVWDLHKFGFNIWIQNAKITLWKNLGQFFRFHRFWSSGLLMRNKVMFNISSISKSMGFT